MHASESFLTWLPSADSIRATVQSMKIVDRVPAATRALDRRREDQSGAVDRHGAEVRDRHGVAALWARD